MASAPYPHLDVHQDVSETLAALGPGLAYSRLLRLRTGSEVEQPSLELECELCIGWEMPDPLTYVFHLREDVTWQDLPPLGARRLTAYDLAYSYNRQRTPDWPNGGLLQAMKSVEALDDYTLKVTLSYPDADFLLALADGHSKIVAREAVEVKGDLKEGPVVGSGPWIWRQGEIPGDSVLTRNGHSFEPGLPFLDRLVIRLVKDEEARFAAFATHQADVYRAAWGLPLQQSRREWQTFLSRQAGTGLILAMNVSRPPFDNGIVRKALFKALDPWSYVSDVWSGQGFVSLGVPVARAGWLVHGEELRGTFGDSPGARKLLEGLGDRRPTRFGLTVGEYGDNYLSLAEKIVEQLKAAGFDLYSTSVNPSQYAQSVWKERDYQLSLGVLPPTSTTNSYLFSVLHSGGRWNLSGQSDRTLDRMIEQQAVELDSAARWELLLETQRHLLDQAYLLVPITGASLWVSWPEVKNLYPNTALSEYFFWARVWRES